MSRGHVSRRDSNSGDALLASIWPSRVDSALIHERVASHGLLHGLQHALGVISPPLPVVSR